MKQSARNFKDNIKCRRLQQFGSLDVMEASYHKQNFSRHAHDCYAFGIVTQGRLDFSYQHRDWQASAGDINLVVPGEVHDGHGGTGDGWSYKMLYMPVELVGEVTSSLSGKDFLPYFLPGVIARSPLAVGLQQLHQVLSDEAETLLRQESAVWNWLAAFIEKYSERRIILPTGRHEDSAVKSAIEYLQEHYEDNVTLKKLASIAGLSPYYLLHVFSSAVGMPPHLYQQMLRVQKAKQLLATGISPVMIASDMGFIDQSHFSRQFKKISGLTPVGYQKMF